MLLDDFSRTDLISARGTAWRGVSDRVMGGVSDVRIARETIAGRAALRLTGTVSLENNGGFVQAAVDLDPQGAPVDLSDFAGLRLTARGNGEAYSVHLKTADTARPWQSYRAGFTADGTWRTLDLPFSGFRPHRVEAPLDTSRVRRLGLVAIGREFKADLAVAELLFYS
ncbi:MAG: CIA30 family protein [Pseudomonadota bacterium]